MRKTIILCFIFLSTFKIMLAQAPSLMSYQAVIWDASGNLVSGKLVDMKISILRDSPTGTVVYSETHRQQTNINGLISLLIGAGTNSTGKISDINWGVGSYLLKTETDPNGESNFSIVGTSQLVSLPYSMHSNTSNTSNTSNKSYNLVTPTPGLPGQILTVDKDGKPIWVSTLPTVSTTNSSAVTPNTAASGGFVTSDGGSPVTARGIVWSTFPNPSISLNTKTNNGNGLGTFTSFLSGLIQNTIYFARAYATNNNGTAYGNEIVFTTLANLPILSTTSISAITTNLSISGGNITSDGGSPVTSRGVVWSTSPNATVSLSTKTNDGMGLGIFNSTLSGLTPNTTYYVRAYASNTAGSGYGNEVSFKTLIGAVPPTVTTNAAKEISYTTFTTGGNVSFNGGANVTARGIVWSQTRIPNITNSAKTANGSGNGVFASYLFDLAPNSIYYVRAYATNSAGTGYGVTDTIKTRAFENCPSTITDIDSNVYNVVAIGNQCWTKDNMKVSRYRNGESIPIMINNAGWESITSGLRCWYANDSTSYEIPYGNSYNWYAAVDERGLCPLGWHVPSDAEWSTLTDYLGGENQAGGKMKSTGTTYWETPNTGSTFESGFSAFPAGFRYNDGGFDGNRVFAFFWSATEYEASARYRSLRFNVSSVFRLIDSKSFGASVRCLRD